MMGKGGGDEDGRAGYTITYTGFSCVSLDELVVADLHCVFSIMLSQLYTQGVYCKTITLVSLITRISTVQLFSCMLFKY